MAAVFVNPCTELIDLGGRRRQAVLSIKPRAYWRDVAGGGQILTENDSALALVDNKLVARGPLTFAMFPALQAGRPLYGLAAGGGKIGLEPLGVNTRTGSNYLDGVGKLIGRQWANAWDNADLRVFWAHHKCEKEIGLRTGHPTQFDWKVWDRTGDLDDNLDLRVLGKRLIGARRPYLYNPADPLAASVPVQIQKREIAGDLYIRMTLPPGEWAGWVLDPTWTSQPGAAEGKDTCIYNGIPNANYGIGNAPSVGFYSTVRRTLIQFALSLIPSGIVTAANLQIYNTNSSSCTASGMFNVLRILAANAWIEGTKNLETGTGEPCWNYRQYDTVNWAGSTGLSTSGTDYSSTSLGLGSWVDGLAETITVNLLLSEFALMQAANYGMILVSTDELTSGKLMASCSSDHATAAYRPMLTVEYTVGKKSNRLLMGVV